MSQPNDFSPKAMQFGASHLFANLDEALARLHYLFEHRRRAGIVLGPSGVGKSELLSRFGKEIRRGGHEVVSLDLYGVQDAEFLWTLAARLGANVQTNDTRFRLWRAVCDRLYENRIQGLQTLMLLDHLNEAHQDVATLVTKLLQAEATASPLLTCVLALDAKHLTRLGSRLPELIDLRIDLEPWSMAETVKHLENQPATTEFEVDFTPSALERLHELSDGLPRKIAHLSGLSQLAAAASDSNRVDLHTVECVFCELSLGGLMQTN